MLWSHITARPIGWRNMMATRTPFLPLIILSLVASSACAPAPRSKEAQGVALYQTCASCHGERGEGRPEYEAPAIAGLEEWYVQAQLEKFRSGHRGAHAKDLPGLRMRPMARQLDGDEDVAAVAAYVSSLEPTHPAPTEQGDVEKGRELFATCSECHGADANGNQAKGAPALRNASDWYLVAQLEKFREGVRGTNPDDVTGGQMRPMALGLADAQAMRDVVAYIVSLRDGGQQHAQR